MASRTLAARLVARARADQIATLYTQWPLTTASMVLGATIMTVVLWGTVAPRVFACWVATILLNQAWRFELVRRYRARPDESPAARASDFHRGDRGCWGPLWALGSTLAGALWGVAGLVLFLPGDPGHQALLIVCLFGVVLGGINLTSVYKPSFYGFALPALLPLMLRVALEGDQVHLFTAAVMLVVLVFVLAFGHNLNNLLTHSLMIRYENVDLIAELTAQTAAADRARAAAEAANRGKTQFLAAASHDLRQPLHAMGLFAATLAARVHEPGARDIVNSINMSVEALERMFTALMDISRLDAGAVEPTRTAFAVAPLFARLEREFAPLARANGLRLAFVPARVWVQSDPVLLERILANLISNAIRNTDFGGVVVGVRRRGSALALNVHDSGIGIANEERERIFDEFYQAPGRRRAARGMGLGLAIIRRLGALLDHPIEIDSTPGRGSRFAVVVPRAADATVAGPGMALATASAPNARSALMGALVAVIDDEPAIVDAMRLWFTQWGATVIGGKTPDELFAVLGDVDRYPDLVVADYRLSGGELGTRVVARLRDELGVDVPALLISGDASGAAIADMRLTCDEMLLKPVLPDALRTLAERMLATRAVAYRTPMAPLDAS